MAFNGSGTYVLPGPALATGNTVSADEHNTFRNDVATALTNCVTRDGQSPATSNLPMGGFKVTGLAAATGNGEAVRYEQLSGYQAALTTASTVALGTANITSLNVSQVAALSTAQISALSVGSITGVLKASSGAVSAATAGTDYVEKGTATVFTAVQTPSQGTATISATGTFTYNPATHGQVCTITCTNADTITLAIATSSLVAGTVYRLIFVAGDTSARTLAIGTGIKAPGAALPITSLSTTSGARDHLVIEARDTSTGDVVGSAADVR